MATRKNLARKIAKSARSTTTAEKPASNDVAARSASLPARVYGRFRNRVDSFLARRPHRSFRLTRRRDYKRSLTLPGYWAFSVSVLRILFGHWRMFGLLALSYAVLTAAFVGIASQDNYSTLTDVLKSTGGQVFGGNWAGIGNASLLFLAAATGSINPTPNSAQQITGALIALLTWLTVVWLLRNILAGHKVRLRDGMYSSAAPLVSTFLVALLLVVQLLPLALAVIAYGAAQSSGLLDGGAAAMLFWAVAMLLALLSLYWVTSTMIALVVVTLPGMYPLRAISTAGDLVVGRRVRILLRLLWMLFVLAIFWVIVMVPVILLDTWLKTVFKLLANAPTIPVLLVIMGSLSIIWISSYVYLLYRKVVDDDAKPA